MKDRAEAMEAINTFPRTFPISCWKEWARMELSDSVTSNRARSRSTMANLVIAEFRIARLRPRMERAIMTRLVRIVFRVGELDIVKSVVK